VLVEADRNLSTKLPALLPDFQDFLRHLSPTIVDDPSIEEVGRAAEVIHHKDAPILAAAVEAGVDYLVTWNTRHFGKASARNYAGFPMMTPGEFLTAFRQALLRDT
jgi:hypothetical protein